MQIGLLADIHANPAALEAVLNEADRRGIDQFLVAGDTVGYNNQPAEVLDLLANRSVRFVRGNHEDTLKWAREMPAAINVFEEKFREPIRAALQLDKAEIDWLTTLPHPLQLELGERKILLSHGTPWDISFYLYEDQRPELFERMAGLRMDLIVMGHTHLPYVKQLGRTLFVNPGSVGMPRGGMTGAFWAIYDTNEMAATLRCEALS